jgi:hypothetical protein
MCRTTRAAPGDHGLIARRESPDGARWGWHPLSRSSRAPAPRGPAGFPGLRPELPTAAPLGRGTANAHGDNDGGQVAPLACGSAERTVSNGSLDVTWTVKGGATKEGRLRGTVKCGG